MPRRLPNLIIGGVNKAATTSLFMYLSEHPAICPSSIKEVQYFLPLRYGALELPPIEEYAQYFDACDNSKYVMEATPGYFYGGMSVAQAIKEQLGDIRIIHLFRNPVDRLFSFYKFKKSMLELDRNISLEEYVRTCESLPSSERKKRKNNVYWGVEGGFYADYINDWFDVFDENHLKILFTGYLKDDPALILTEICKWLGIDYTEFLASAELSLENRTVYYKNRLLQRLALLINWSAETYWRSHPRLKRALRRMYYSVNGDSNNETMSESIREYLESVYKPYNKRLAYELTNRGYLNLPNWLSRELNGDLSAKVENRVIETPCVEEPGR